MCNHSFVSWFVGSVSVFMLLTCCVVGSLLWGEVFVVFVDGLVYYFGWVV